MKRSIRAVMTGSGTRAGQEIVPPRPAFRGRYSAVVSTNFVDSAGINREILRRLKVKPSLDWLLIFVPLAIILRFWPGSISPTALFVCSALGIIPVAGWIGRATEALASRFGEGLGGLLNATFGNAAELIIAGIALSKGLTNVVKASLTGSIIGNVLLVLGLSILLGGTKYKEQKFNRTAARTSVISLSLAAIGLIIPTVFHLAAHSSPGGWSPLIEQKLSLGVAVVLLLTYFCMLGFSLRSHKHLFRSCA